MELVEDQLLALVVLLLKKSKIEQQLRKTFRCFLRKCFSCCGMKNIENELKFLNESIEAIKDEESKLTKSEISKLTKSEISKLGTKVPSKITSI